MTDREWRDAWQSGRTLQIAHGAKLSFYEVAAMGPERLAAIDHIDEPPRQPQCFWVWSESKGFEIYPTDSGSYRIVAVEEPQQAPVRPNPAAMCRCGHRRQFHEGRRLLCLIAGCFGCNGFDLSDEP